MAEPPAAMRLMGRLLAALGVAAALALLVGLGTWQLERLRWKEGLIAEIDARIHAPPLDVGAVARMAGAGQAVDYRTMAARGTFLHDRERHFFATFEGRTGFYVYTPLVLEDGRILLVNRGFVPYDNKDRATRPGGLVAGQVLVRGLARDRLESKPGMLVPDNQPDKNIFYWKDLDAMAETAGLDRSRLLPFFLDADAAPIPGGMPQGGVTIIDLPNNHLQYALTWYGLAAALAAVVGVSLMRRRPRPAVAERDGS